MTFPPVFLDEIRNRVGLADVVGRRANLTRKGSEYVGLCPFHKEKTPSFTVAEDKGFYHCFGCGAHGDVIGFVMETESVPFPEAVARLAGQAGLEMPSQTPEDREQAERAKTLHEVLETAARWYSEQLGGQGGAQTRDYLEGRGVSREMAGRFRLGFAPRARTLLRDSLRARKISDDLMFEAGLIIRPDDGGEPFDRFRDRLMFPIADRRGQVIAFGGRALGEARAKYLNSPETPVFHKGDVLYNLNQAAPAIRKSGRAVVVEGYMDVIALARAGVDYGVAPLGTALTERQIQLLWRMTPEPTLCFDGDQAGERAANRAVDRALPLLKAGHSLTFCQLPPGEDPDTLVNAGGPQAITSLLEKSQPLSERLWSMLTMGKNFDTPERLAGLKVEVQKRTDLIPDSRVKEHYRDLLYARVEAAFAPRRRGGAPRRGPSRKGRAIGKTSEFGGSRVARGGVRGVEVREQALILTMINHPALLERLHEEFAEIEFGAPELDKLRNEIIGIAARDSELDRDGLRRQISKVGLGALVERLDHGVSAMRMWQALPDAALEDVKIGWRSLLAMHGLSGLEAQLAEARNTYEADMSEANLSRMTGLQMEIETLKNDQAHTDGRFGEASGRLAKL